VNRGDRGGHRKHGENDGEARNHRWFEAAHLMDKVAASYEGKRV
jgi:hypothetical protein